MENQQLAGTLGISDAYLSQPEKGVFIHASADVLFVIQLDNPKKLCYYKY
ncbi:MAG: hypothetical protein ACI4I9_10020 [Porcipelethomonas sp.]